MAVHEEVSDQRPDLCGSLTTRLLHGTRAQVSVVEGTGSPPSRGLAGAAPGCADALPRTENGIDSLIRDRVYEETTQWQLFSSRNHNPAGQAFSISITLAGRSGILRIGFPVASNTADAMAEAASAFAASEP